MNTLIFSIIRVTCIKFALQILYINKDADLKSYDEKMF